MPIDFHNPSRYHIPNYEKLLGSGCGMLKNMPNRQFIQSQYGYNLNTIALDRYIFPAIKQYDQSLRVGIKKQRFGS